jgi:hypothetical protein
MSMPSRGRESTRFGWGVSFSRPSPTPFPTQEPNLQLALSLTGFYESLRAFLVCYLSVPGMFAHGFNESKAGTINLVDMSYPVFVALVRFLYTDNIPPPSVEAIVLPLLQQVMIRPPPNIQPVH